MITSCQNELCSHRLGTRKLAAATEAAVARAYTEPGSAAASAVAAISVDL